MEKTRPILYGVSDYAELRRRNGWFIDRTAKIRDFGTPPRRRLTGTTDVSSVALHRLVLVFHGGECVLTEEV